LYRYVLILVGVLCWCRPASAQLNELTLVMTIDTDPSGILLSGSGTAAASAGFGSLQAFGGTVPSGVTKTVGASSWTLSTTIDVKVSKGTLDVADILSTSYTLSAELESADSTNIWRWNSMTLSTSSATITSSGTYNSTPSYTFSLTIPFSESAHTISNTIQMTAVAN
jgi:hypothetical protein